MLQDELETDRRHTLSALAMKGLASLKESSSVRSDSRCSPPVSDDGGLEEKAAGLQEKADHQASVRVQALRSADQSSSSSIGGGQSEWFDGRPDVVGHHRSTSHMLGLPVLAEVTEDSYGRPGTYTGGAAEAGKAASRRAEPLRQQVELRGETPNGSSIGVLAAAAEDADDDSMELEEEEDKEEEEARQALAMLQDEFDLDRHTSSASRVSTANTGATTGKATSSASPKESTVRGDTRCSEVSLKGVVERRTVDRPSESSRSAGYDSTVRSAGYDSTPGRLTPSHRPSGRAHTSEYEDHLRPLHSRQRSSAASLGGGETHSSRLSAGSGRVSQATLRDATRTGAEVELDRPADFGFGLPGDGAEHMDCQPSAPSQRDRLPSAPSPRTLMAVGFEIDDDCRAEGWGKSGRAGTSDVLPRELRKASSQCSRRGDIEDSQRLGSFHAPAATGSVALSAATASMPLSLGEERSQSRVSIESDWSGGVSQNSRAWRPRMATLKNPEDARDIAAELRRRRKQGKLLGETFMSNSTAGAAGSRGSATFTSVRSDVTAAMSKAPSRGDEAEMAVSNERGRAFTGGSATPLVGEGSDEQLQEGHVGGFESDMLGEIVTECVHTQQMHTAVRDFWYKGNLHDTGQSMWYKEVAQQSPDYFPELDAFCAAELAALEAHSYLQDDWLAEQSEVAAHLDRLRQVHDDMRNLGEEMLANALDLRTFGEIVQCRFRAVEPHLWATSALLVRRDALVQQFTLETLGPKLRSSAQRLDAEAEAALSEQLRPRRGAAPEAEVSGIGCMQPEALASLRDYYIERKIEKHWRLGLKEGLERRSRSGTGAAASKVAAAAVAAAAPAQPAGSPRAEEKDAAKASDAPADSVGEQSH